MVFTYNVNTDLFINTNFDITSSETLMKTVFKFPVILWETGKYFLCLENKYLTMSSSLWKMKWSWKNPLDSTIKVSGFLFPSTLSCHLTLGSLGFCSYLASILDYQVYSNLYLCCYYSSLKLCLQDAKNCE